VENSSLAGRRVGPRGPVLNRPLTPAQAALVDRLLEQPEPLSLASLVTVTGQHENTIREHLAELVRRGQVRRHRAEINGRGRPAWLYELVDDRAPRSEYAGLAAALAGSIARTSDDPSRDAIHAGEEWGRELARERGATASSPTAAREHTRRILADLGFEPQAGEDEPQTTRLTPCPLLEAAYRHQEVVCAVHLGIVHSLIVQHGADPTGTELIPFAEPGACLLTMPPLEPDDSRRSIDSPPDRLERQGAEPPTTGRRTRPRAT
jgi:predicted ArsR family transcriptional regulator